MDVAWWQVGVDDYGEDDCPRFAPVLLTLGGSL